MPYREKVGWLYLMAMSVTFGPYFAFVASSPHSTVALPNFRQLGLFGVTAIAEVIILGIGYLYLFLQFPEEARTPIDERDRAIMQRSITSAYSVLMFSMILVGVVMPFNSGGWTIVNGTLFMIVAAEIVRYGVTVFLYRRQA